MKFPHSIRISVAAVCAAFASSFAPSAIAGIVPCGSCTAPTLSGQTSSGDRDTTQAFAGINWAFGTGPELIVGVRQLRTNERHRVVGAKVEASFPFTKQSIGYDKLRLRLIGGHRDAMAELGGGYSFLGKGFLLSGAVQTNFVVLGTDFTLNSFQWQPFVGVNTLDRPKAPTLGSNGTLTCPPNYLLGNASDNGAAPGQTVNGQTCVFNNQS